MSRSYRRVDRDQSFLLPPDMRDWLPVGHLVWFIIDVVEKLDTSAFHAQHPRSGPGRAAYDPDMLLAVLLYSYAAGERSSRQIERLCTTDVAFRVLCGGDVPDHTRFARFRQQHQGLFQDLFEQVLMLCAQAGMGQVGVVAIDGTKIAANASAGATRTEASLRKELAGLRAAARVKAREILAEAEQVDAGEDEQFGAGVRGDELAPQFKDPARRAEAIAAALAEIEKAKASEAAEKAAQEAKAAEFMAAIATGMVGGVGPKGTDPIEVARTRLATAERIVAETTDSRERGQARRAATIAADRLTRLIAQQAEKQTQPGKKSVQDVGKDDALAGAGKAHRANVTDPESRSMKSRTGWLQGFNAQLAVSQDHLILAVALTQDTNDLGCFTPMMDAAVAAAARIQDVQGCRLEDAGIAMILADAGYFSEDNITAAGPDRLIASGTRYDMSKAAAKDPASGPPPATANPKDAMRHRLREPSHAALYKRRAATVEPVNAHLKDGTGLRRFARRGLTAATSELNLAAAVVNLRKLHRLTISPASQAGA